YVSTSRRVSFALHSFPSRRSSDLILVVHIDSRDFCCIFLNFAVYTAQNPSRPGGDLLLISYRHLPQFYIFAYISVKGSVNAIFRSEEHTSELQSRFDLVCRLLLEN